MVKSAIPVQPDWDYNMHMCNKDLKALHFLCSMDFMRRGEIYKIKKMHSVLFLKNLS
jgi:hypothetical protein